jgi:hypothetical protein
MSRIIYFLADLSIPVFTMSLPAYACAHSHLHGGNLWAVDGIPERHPNYLLKLSVQALSGTSCSD